MLIPLSLAGSPSQWPEEACFINYHEVVRPKSAVSQPTFPAFPPNTHTFGLARVVVRAAVVMMVRVQFHVSAPIEGVQPSEETLQGIGLEKRVILGNPGYVDGKL